MGSLLAGNSSINHQLQNTLSHAYMVAGEEGSGRSLVLRFLAQKALCHHQSACGQCPSCHKFLGKNHPDYKEYGMEKVLNVEEVRDIRREALRMPNDGEKAVFVLFRGEEFHTSSQNALLKILEEPPRHAVFILVTNESATMLETIRSRVQLLTLRPVPLEDCLTWTGRRYPNNPQALQWARECQGILGRVVAQVEPAKYMKTVVAQEEQESRESFHQMKTNRKKVVKKPMAPPVADGKLKEIAEKIVVAMEKKQELSLLEACIALEKLDKSQLLLVIDDISQRLSRHLLQYKTKDGLFHVKLLGEILVAVDQFNMGGEQVAGWLTAETMVGGRR